MREQYIQLKFNLNLILNHFKSNVLLKRNSLMCLLWRVIKKTQTHFSVLFADDLPEDLSKPCAASCMYIVSLFRKLLCSQFWCKTRKWVMYYCVWLFRFPIEPFAIRSMFCVVIHNSHIIVSLYKCDTRRTHSIYITYTYALLCVTCDLSKHLRILNLHADNSELLVNACKHIEYNFNSLGHWQCLN